MKCKRNRDQRNKFSSKIVLKICFFPPQRCHELAKTFWIIFLLFSSLDFCNSFSLLLWSIMPKNISAKCKQVMGVFTASSFFTPFLLEPNILTTYFGHIHTFCLYWTHRHSILLYISSVYVFILQGYMYMLGFFYHTLYTYSIIFLLEFEHRSSKII